MKIFLILMLMASYAVADLSPPQRNDPVVKETDNTDVILLILQQIKGDVAQLNTKVDSLQATTDYLTATTDNLLTTTDNLQTTTDALQTTVGVLTLKVRNNEDDIADLTLKEQSDYNQLDADISELESNCNELRDDISALTATCSCNEVTTPPCQFRNGFNYTYVETRLSWEDARANCVSLGGDIAYHGLDDMTFREEVLCGQLNLCNNGRDEQPWIGLTKVSSSPARWEYLDGTPSPDDDTWIGGNYDYAGNDCATYGNVEYDYNFSLHIWSLPCTHTMHSICEFAC